MICGTENEAVECMLVDEDTARNMVRLAKYMFLNSGIVNVVTRKPDGGEIAVNYDGRWEIKLTGVRPRRGHTGLNPVQANYLGDRHLYSRRSIIIMRDSSPGGCCQSDTLVVLSSILRFRTWVTKSAEPPVAKW